MEWKDLGWDGMNDLVKKGSLDNIWLDSRSFGLHLLTQISRAINAAGTSEHVGAMNVELHTKEKNVC